ncbi:MAG: hypothetical protein M3Y27_12095 [Acidobacteriota bacterium]|nr:hypothetical protein [Acidobacteriota bacterium]
MLTPKVLWRRDWNSPAKLIRAREALLDRGLIKYTRKAGRNKFHKASLFAFTDLDVQRNDAFGIPGSQATQDYLSLDRTSGETRSTETEDKYVPKR